MNYNATLDLTKEWTSAEEIRNSLNLATDGTVYVTELTDQVNNEAQTAIVYVMNPGTALYGGQMYVRIHQNLEDCIRDLAGLVGL